MGASTGTREGSGLLVFSGADLGAEAAPWSVVERHPLDSGKRDARRFRRDRSLAAPAEVVAVVPVPEALEHGWLEAAAGLLRDGAAAVVVPADRRSLAGTPCPVGAATLFSGPALRQIGGLLEPFDGLGAACDALWRLGNRGSVIAECPGWVSSVRPLPEPGTGMLLAVAANNLEVNSLRDVLGPWLLALVAQPLREANVDTTVLDLAVTSEGDDLAALALPRGALDGAGQVEVFVSALQRVRSTRPLAQSTRRLGDSRRWPEIQAFMDVLWSRSGGDRQGIEAAFPRSSAGERLRRCLLVYDSADPGAGDAVSRCLSALDGGWQFRCWDARDNSLRERQGGDWQIRPSGDLASWPDVVVMAGMLMRSVPWLHVSTRPVLLDLSGGIDSDQLAHDLPGLGSGRGAAVAVWMDTLARADHFLVANEAQRDWMLGALSGCGRVTVLAHAEDRTLNRLVEVAGSDVVAGIAAWCRTPLRAIDLVSSLPSQASGRWLNDSPGQRLSDILRRTR